MINKKPESCPVCKAGGVRVFPIYHHMICAYVGPSYDFTQVGEVMSCPKCKRRRHEDRDDWEIVGDCFYCDECGAEVHS